MSKEQVDVVEEVVKLLEKGASIKDGGQHSEDYCWDKLLEEATGLAVNMPMDVAKEEMGKKHLNLLDEDIESIFETISLREGKLKKKEGNKRKFSEQEEGFEIKKIIEDIFEELPGAYSVDYIDFEDGMVTFDTAIDWYNEEDEREDAMTITVKFDIKDEDWAVDREIEYEFQPPFDVKRKAKEIVNEVLRKAGERYKTRKGRLKREGVEKHYIIPTEVREVISQDPLTTQKLEVRDVVIKVPEKAEVDDSNLEILVRRKAPAGYMYIPKVKEKRMKYGREGRLKKEGTIQLFRNKREAEEKRREIEEFFAEPLEDKVIRIKYDESDRRFGMRGFDFEAIPGEYYYIVGVPEEVFEWGLKSKIVGVEGKLKKKGRRVVSIERKGRLFTDEELRELLTPEDFEKLFDGGHPSAWVDFHVGEYVVVMWNPEVGKFEVRVEDSKKSSMRNKKYSSQDEEEGISDVWELETSEEQQASDMLDSVYVQPALEGDRKAQNFLRKVWDGESWDSIKDKLQTEGSVWYVWWMDGVHKFMSMMRPDLYKYERLERKKRLRKSELNRKAVEELKVGDTFHFTKVRQSFTIKEDLGDKWLVVDMLEREQELPKTIVEEMIDSGDLEKVSSLNRKAVEELKERYKREVEQNLYRYERRKKRLGSDMCDYSVTGGKLYPEHENRPEIKGEVMEWLRNIADNYNEDIDTNLYSQLIDMAKELDLDFRVIDKNWQWYSPGDKVSAEELYRELVQNQIEALGRKHMISRSLRNRRDDRSEKRLERRRRLEGSKSRFSEQGKHYIGEEYQGGIVFHLDPDGRSGLIVSKEDLGDGNVCNVTWDEAIDIARSYNGGGYNDWYLPSKEELNLLYRKQDNVGGFINDSYWSSTEDRSYYAWGQYFGDGFQSSFDKLSFTLRVRPVRKFTDNENTIEGRSKLRGNKRKFSEQEKSSERTMKDLWNEFGKDTILFVQQAYLQGYNPLAIQEFLRKKGEDYTETEVIEWIKNASLRRKNRMNFKRRSRSEEVDLNLEKRRYSSMIRRRAEVDPERAFEMTVEFYEEPSSSELSRYFHAGELYDIEETDWGTFLVTGGVGGWELKEVIKRLEQDSNVGDAIYLRNRDTGEEYTDWGQVRKLVRESSLRRYDRKIHY